MTDTSTPDDRAAARLSRWAERDAVIGLTAEAEQMAARLLEREREVVNLRERTAQLAQHVAQLTSQRDRLQFEVLSLRQPSVASRFIGKARRAAGRALRR